MNDPQIETEIETEVPNEPQPSSSETEPTLEEQVKSISNELVTPKTNVTPTPEIPNKPQNIVTDPTSGTDDDDQAQKDKTNHTFAQMRVESKKQQERLSKLEALAKINGYDNLDVLEKELRDKSIKKQAQTLNVSEEIAARLDRLDKLEADANRTAVTNKITTEWSSVSEKYDLSKEDTESFAKSIQGKVDLYNNNIPLEALLIMYKPDIVASRLQAKQQVIKDNIDNTAPILATGKQKSINTIANSLEGGLSRVFTKLK